MTIGETIRSLRKARKLTQEQLAEYLNVSSQAVSKWETGLSCPDIETLPKLALFFQVSMDQLFDFDRRKANDEVAALVAQSVPLRDTPEAAEAFYREALKKYPNNEVLLNCLLMVIPNTRSDEKLRIGERILDCTADDEIRYDVLRLMTQTCHAVGEDAIAESYLGRIPELYFLKTEIAAAIRHGDAQREAIGITETVCIGTLLSMLALRGRNGEDAVQDCADALLAYARRFPEHWALADRLAAEFQSGAILDFYR